MMSDHWKAIARLLGAAGAAEPTQPPVAETKPVAAEPSLTEPVETKKPTGRKERKQASERESNDTPSPVETRLPDSGHFGAGLLGSVEISVGGSGNTSEAEDFGTSEGSGENEVSSQKQDDDLLNFSSFNALDDEREEPARRLFGTSRASTSKSSDVGSDPGDAGTTVADSQGSDSASASSGQDVQAEAPRGLDRIFGELEPSKEPSSWDSLVDRLGVETSDVGASEKVPVKASGERAESARTEPKVTEGKRSSGQKKPSGFGVGLGLDLPDDDFAEDEVEANEVEIEPAAAEKRGTRESQSEPRARSKPVDSEVQAKPEAVVDPLAELGSEGWGTPRRSRSVKASEDVKSSENRSPARESRSAKSAVPRGERIAESAVAPDKTEKIAERTERDVDPESSEGRGARRGERAGEDSKEGGATPARRGRRRGQRQKMSEELTGTVEFEKRGPGRRQEFDNDDELFESVDDTGDDSIGTDDPMDGAIARTGDDEDAETPSRRRRRRGRRRRGSEENGGGAEEEKSREAAFGERKTGEPKSAPSSSGRAIDAEFDDDHEDDEEAVVLRRSRRRRRRGGEESKEVVSDSSGSVDDFIDEEDDEDEQEAVSYNIQRNVPTWLDAVEVLVNTNIDNRKRDPKRSGGGSSSGGGGRGSRTRR